MHVAIRDAPLAAEGKTQIRCKLGGQLQRLLRRHIDEAMIGGGDHGALAAREAPQQLAEGGIDDGELRCRLGALAAMAMREGVVVRPVRVDELALRAALHCVLELRYEVVRVVVSNALRAAAMHAVVVRIDDLAIRDDDGLHGERREDWLQEPDREVHIEVVEAPSRLVWWWGGVP